LKTKFNEPVLLLDQILMQVFFTQKACGKF